MPKMQRVFNGNYISSTNKFSKVQGVFERTAKCT